MISESRSTESRALTWAETIVADVMSAVRAGVRAMEAEAAATIELEQAYKKANDAAAELKNAIKSEAEAKVEVDVARRETKLPFREEGKALKVAAKADRDEERATDKVEAEQAKAKAAEQKGKLPKQAAIDKAKLQAAQAAQRAKAAHAAADTAKEDSEVARAGVRAAQEREKLAAMRVRAAKIEDAGAKRDVEKAEDNAKKTIGGAKEALATEGSAKKALDRSIRMLKGVMREEAKAVEAGDVGGVRVTRRPEVAQPRAKSATGRPIGKLKTLPSRIVRTLRLARRSGPVGPARQDVGQTAKTTKIETKAIGRARPVRQEDAKAYSGVLRLLIYEPVDHADLIKLREGLQRIDGLRVVSIGGSSSGGTSITVVAEKPVPLAARLDELDVVEKVTKKGKDIELRIRLPEARPAASPPRITTPAVTR